MKIRLFETRASRKSHGHVVHLLPSLEVREVERVVLTLSREMVRRGWRVTVLSCGEVGPMWELFVAAGVDIEVLDASHQYDLTLPRRLSQVLQRIGADLLHTHHFGGFVHGTIAARSLGVPHVHTEHAGDLQGALDGELEGRLLEHVSHVLCIDRGGVTRHPRRSGLCSHLIPNGVAPAASVPGARERARALMGVSEEEFVVGCVAQMSPEKDHRTLIKAFEKLHQRAPQARLVLVGDGLMKGIIKAEVFLSGLEHAVHFLGPRPDVDDIYPGFDVIASTSLVGDLPLAVLEAMGHGIPAVSTCVGDVPALFEHGGGAHVKPGDVDALACLLQLYLEDSSKRLRDGLRAREVVRMRYSVEAMVDRYDDVYDLTLHEP